MTKLLFLLLMLSCTLTAFTQQEKFDLITYTIPKGWKKQKTDNAIQLIREDAAKGTYCTVSIVKSLPGGTSSKDNFTAAWETLVKEMVTVKAEPEMDAAVMENGWEILSGYAPFEIDGANGIAMLLTGTGYDKMANIVVLTNTDTYQKELTFFLESITLAKPSATGNIGNLAKPGTVTPPTKIPAVNSGFTFNTSNFDDGWTSTVQEDWVEVAKGNIKVLLHYPKEGTIFPADPEPLTNAAWNILVSPRYSNLRNYRTAYISMYNRPYLGMGYATDNTSRKEVYIVFFRQGDTGWLEFIASDKNSFTQQFKFDPETIRWDSQTELLDPLSLMVNYNKFAVAASDFKGTWSSDFTGLQHMYNVYTGNYAGMNMHQSNQTFQFVGGSTYRWEILVVSGPAGNAKYANVKSSGKFSVPNNWQINFTNIEGKPKLYNAYFSCIKGARFLKLLDSRFPGSGIPTVFGKK